MLYKFLSQYCVIVENIISQKKQQITCIAQFKPLTFCFGWQNIQEEHEDIETMPY